MAPKDPKNELTVEEDVDGLGSSTTSQRSRDTNNKAEGGGSLSLRRGGTNGSTNEQTSSSVLSSSSSSIYSEEQAVWAEMTPLSWHNAICHKTSIFGETYDKTREQIVQVCLNGNHDIIIELGCGTGEVIGELKGLDHVTRVGMDFNPDFLRMCDETYTQSGVEWIEQDVTLLNEWWFKYNSDDKYTKPLLVCVNNTLNIMPEEIRSDVLNNMMTVAGSDGKCVLSYWNGKFFSHAIMGFYLKNPNLCGPFDIKQHVDWNNNTLETPSGYSTHWQTPYDVQKLMTQNDINLEIQDNIMIGKDHINTDGLSIFVWFSGKSSTAARAYYDSNDAQTFYSKVWGEETIHIGRYDLLTNDDRTTLTKTEQISKAEDLHEQEFMKLISSKYNTSSEKLRILDMGCGYGGLLRQLWTKGLIWNAIGCDIAGKMCNKAREHNERIGCSDDITILEESYLNTSAKDESIDLVISMDALLHVGPTLQRDAMKEASRVLRPYGWMIFTDIMQKEIVDANEMKPIYDRIHLSKMGTVSNYKDALELNGFTNFTFIPHSCNVTSHYGTVRDVLMEVKDTIGVSQDFAIKMLDGLATWRDLAPKNLEWGFILAQKTSKVVYTL